MTKSICHTMSAFGVKSPLSRAVITKNLYYNSAEDIHQYLSDLFKDDRTRFYTILTSEDIKSFKNNNYPLIIKRVQETSHAKFFFLIDPSSQKSTYVLVNPVSKVILLLAFQKKVKLFNKSQRHVTMIQQQKVNLKTIMMMTMLNLMLKHTN